MPRQDPLIQIKHLNVTYFAGKSNEVRALQDISLEIFPGEFIVFFGPSGCGKSTLLYSIAGLERNIEGDIIVKNKNLTLMKQHELEEYHQKTIGMIFQSFYLINSLTIAENVALPQVGLRAKVTDRTAKALSLLNKFGVGAQADKLATELSGGQQQRVAICRSLMNDPDILIADEPVGNLDSKSSQDVMDLLRHLNDVEKRAIILVTHDPSHLRHAHRIFYLRDGKITGTKTNTPEERVQSSAAAGMSSIMSPAAIRHWIRAYTPEQSEESTLSLVHKVQQIMAEVMTGLTLEEWDTLADRIHGLLGRKGVTLQEIIAYLHRPVRQGGIGMTLARARSLAKEIQSLTHEMDRLQAIEAKAKKKKATSNDIMNAQARELRLFLLHSFNTHLSGLQAVAAMDDVIIKRLHGDYDRAKVQHMLDLPIKKGGAGLDTRVARKMSRRLETLVAASVSVEVPKANNENA